jgi:hypothetical protein
LKKLFLCRRSSLALIGMACLTYLGINNNLDVSLAIAGLVASVAGANAFEKSKQLKGE